MKATSNVLTLLLVMLFLAGCSQSSTNPVSQDSLVSMSQSKMHSSLGILGAFDLLISDNGSRVELTPARISSIGEGYIINGLAYFSIFPCADCLKMKSIGIDGTYVKLVFSISHPFAKGDTGQDPTASNRLDLDVFDMALVIVPSSSTATSYTQTSATVYTGICANMDGYTTELTNVLSDSAACPYFLVIDDNDSATLSNNRFEMGTTNQEFETWFQQGTFKMYLTMGYGASAVKADRLAPTYYVPEFNRKAAWKVDVAPVAFSGSSPSTVTIDIYDWNHGATIAGTYPDSSNLDHISSASNIQTVTVEVPGMTAAIVTAGTTDTTTDGYSDPITYTASFANDNGIPDGTYTGLVKVLDSRSPGTVIIGGETDTLVDTTDGINLNWLAMPEYAAYQTFVANVGTAQNGWTVTWGTVGVPPALPGNVNCNDVAVSPSGDIYVIGDYYETAQFDPTGGTLQSTSSAYADMYLTKFDSSGAWQWTNLFGSNGSIVGNGVTVDTTGNVYITGYFEQTVDFQYGAGDVWHTSNGAGDIFLAKYDSNGLHLWSKSMGSTDSTWGDAGWDVAVDSAWVYITGHFVGTCYFNPPGGDPHTKLGTVTPTGVFLAAYDQSGGNWMFTKTWCTENDPAVSGMGLSVDTYGTSPNDYVYVSGFYSGTNVAFGSENHSQIGAGLDVFVSKHEVFFAGQFVWTKTWDALTGRSVATDQNGNILVAGEYDGTVDFDPGSLPTEIDNHTSNGGWDAYVSKFAPDGTFTWARTWGGTVDNDWCFGVTTDSAGSVMTTGPYGDTVNFDTGGGTLNYTSNGSKDIFVNKHDDLGNFIWAYSMGGTGDDRGFGVATDQLDQIYAAGVYSNIVNFDISGGTDNHTSGGMYDAYLKMFYP